MKSMIIASLIASATAFAPSQQGRASTAVNAAFSDEIGAMAPVSIFILSYHHIKCKCIASCIHAGRRMLPLAALAFIVWLFTLVCNFHCRCLSPSHPN